MAEIDIDNAEDTEILDHVADGGGDAHRGG